MSGFASLPYSEACERNKGPILAVLADALQGVDSVLEIGSGTGQHAVHFASSLPHLEWQTSDRVGAVDAVRARLALRRPANLREPLIIDVCEDWGDVHAEAVFTANTFHIMSWTEVQAFFAGLHKVLQHPGVVCVYGPFRYDGAHTSQSNEHFDRSLRAGSPHMGVRDFEAVDALARAQGLQLDADCDMPANNRLLIWRVRRDTEPC